MHPYRMRKTHTILFKTMLLALREDVFGIDMRTVGTKCTTQTYAVVDMNVYLQCEQEGLLIDTINMLLLHAVMS